MTCLWRLLIATPFLLCVATMPVEGMAQDPVEVTAPSQEAIAPTPDTLGMTEASATPVQEPEAGEPAPLPPPRTSRAIVRIGQGFTVMEDAVIRELVVVMGAAEIFGTVERDVVVVLGTIDVGPNAVIGGDLVSVAGSTRLSEGAVIEGDLTVVAGDLDAPAGFSPSGESVVVGGFGGFTNRLGGAIPWFSRGLLWGRPIVPDLPWIWALVGAVSLAYLALSYLFDRPLRACTGVLVERPLSASLIGLLVLVLMGPVSFLLAVSVVGLAVIPFALIALLAAALLGRIAVLRWIGVEIVPEGPVTSRWRGARSCAIGLLVVTVIYLIPVLGFVAWALIGVFGLGAVTLAFADRLRHESPRPSPHDHPIRPPSVAPYDSEQEITADPKSEDAADPLPADGRQPSTHTYERPLDAAIPAPDDDLLSLPRAGFLDRTGAFILDILLVAIVGSILGLTGRGASIGLLLLVYHIGFWGWKATTIGGIICHLRIVRVDGGRLRFIDALVRGLSSIFSLIVVGLGALWILKDPERQSWHDKIAGTYVVKVHGNHPL